jgi:hypothetical protein
LFGQVSALKVKPRWLSVTICVVVDHDVIHLFE